MIFTSFTSKQDKQPKKTKIDEGVIEYIIIIIPFFITKLLKGKVKSLPKPNIGWAKVNVIKKNKIINKNLNFEEFYFLHQFFIEKHKNAVALLKPNITAIVNKENI